MTQSPTTNAPTPPPTRSTAITISATSSLLTTTSSSSSAASSSPWSWEGASLDDTPGTVPSTSTASSTFDGDTDADAATGAKGDGDDDDDSALLTNVLVIMAFLFISVIFVFIFLMVRGQKQKQKFNNSNNQWRSGSAATFTGNPTFAAPAAVSTVAKKINEDIYGTVQEFGSSKSSIASQSQDRSNKTLDRGGSFSRQSRSGSFLVHEAMKDEEDLYCVLPGESADGRYASATTAMKPRPLPPAPRRSDTATVQQRKSSSSSKAGRSKTVAYSAAREVVLSDEDVYGGFADPTDGNGDGGIKTLPANNPFASAGSAAATQTNDTPDRTGSTKSAKSAKSANSSVNTVCVDIGLGDSDEDDYEI